MIYLSQTLYPWWLAAFALGLAAAFLAPRGGGRFSGAWLAFVLSLFGLGAVAALAHAVPGRAGLWLETGVLALTAYGVGCLVGAALAAPFAIGARVAVSPGAGASALAANRTQPTQEPPVATAAPAPPPYANDEAAPAREAPASVAPIQAAAAAVVVAQALLKLVEGPSKAPAGEAAPALQAQPEDACDGAAGRGRPQAIERPEAEDDLRLIRGVDSAMSQELHELGVWRLGQIAAWGPEQIAWIAQRFGEKSPVSPAHWPAQARLLAAGALTDHARAVLSGEQPGPADDEALAAWLKGLPQPAAPGAADGFYAGARPMGFSEPPLGESDDLTRLSGVDAELAARLNGLGVWTWRQIACWAQENARWIGAYLATPGVPEREDWVGQARALASQQKHHN